MSTICGYVIQLRVNSVKNPYSLSRSVRVSASGETILHHSYTQSVSPWWFLFWIFQFDFQLTACFFSRWLWLSHWYEGSFFPIYRAQTNLLQSLKYGKFNLTLRIQFSRKISIKESFANEKRYFFLESIDKNLFLATNKQT